MEPPSQFLSENIKRLYELDFNQLRYSKMEPAQLNFFLFIQKY